MKATELRIGNLIRFNNLIESEKIIEVGGWFFRPFNKNDMVEVNSYYQPIPLTEEWLLKLGFTDNEYTFDLKANKKILSFGWSSRVVSTGYRSGLSCKKYRHIKYVHQLQNLYFALTSEELTLRQADHVTTKDLQDIDEANDDKLNK